MTSLVVCEIAAYLRAKAACLADEYPEMAAEYRQAADEIEALCPA